jgi:hypothetical protein
MMAYNAYGALVVVRRVRMVMGRRNACGCQEEDNEKKCKAFIQVHGVPSSHRRRVLLVERFVNRLNGIVLNGIGCMVFVFLPSDFTLTAIVIAKL